MGKIKRWLQRFRFEFYFDIYLIRLRTLILTRPYERDCFDVCRLRVELLHKKVIEFDLYRVPDRYW